MKNVRYAIEAALVYIFFIFFRMIGLDAASACGGWIGRTVGPHLAASRKAFENLRRAMPERSESERRAIVKGMWDNLGRVIAEYPHLEKIGRERVELPERALLDRLREDGMPAIVATAHMANWEVAVPAMLLQGNLPTDMVARVPNNPMTARILERARTLNGRLRVINKSKSSVRQLLESMKKGGHIAMLVDQKYNEGVAVPFFGSPAMTSTAFVQLCQKFKCPLVFGRLERLGGARFRLTPCDPPLTLFDAAGAHLPAETVIAEAHTRLEKWIRERPEQWLWLHRRWPRGN